jgi:hypothetical protein
MANVLDENGEVIDKPFAGQIGRRDGHQVRYDSFASIWRRYIKLPSDDYVMDPTIDHDATTAEEDRAEVWFVLGRFAINRKNGKIILG